MNTLYLKLRSLSVFRTLIEKDPVMLALQRFLRCDPTNSDEAVDAYCDFTCALYRAHRTNLSKYIGSIVNDDENMYIRAIGSGKPISEEIRASVDRELAILQEAADLTPEVMKADIQYDVALPNFETESVELAKTYHHRCSNIGKYGYGIYSRYYMFYLNDDGEIVPVQNPDSISLSHLIDYKREQKLILDNTHALLCGKPAANMLLTGDAGTGKSSTIKAVVNELWEEGLRILEVRKEQLYQLPGVLDELSENPLKFIIFVDDLSFAKDDDNFGALKAILEGSVSARSGNVVIYATSNRRHLVKESFNDREGDDIHRNDTMQEIVSLSDRFGLQITFRRPDKNTFLNIVKSLALEASIQMPEEELYAGAERFVLGRGNRSARAAKQYIDSILAAEPQK